MASLRFSTSALKSTVISYNSSINVALPYQKNYYIVYHLSQLTHSNSYFKICKPSFAKILN